MVKINFTFIILFIIFYSSCACCNTYLPAKAIKLKRQSGYFRTMTFLGKTTVEKTSTVGFEIAGLVKKIFIHDGQKVQKGQPLAQLDQEKLIEQKKRLMAEAKSIQANLTLANLNEKRLAKLVKNNNVSQQEYDTEKARVDQLAANLEQVKANIKLTEIEIERSTIKAPFDATIIRRLVHEGAFVSASQGVIELQQVHINEAHIGIPQPFLKYFPLKSHHTIKIHQQTYQGYVYQKLKNVSDNTQTVRVIFKLKTNKNLLSGEVASLTIKEKIKEPGAWIPETALVQGLRGTWVVYVLTSTQKNPSLYQIQSYQVQVLYAINDRAYIKTDLTNGALIVSQGTHKYVPGQIVTLIKQ